MSEQKSYVVSDIHLGVRAEVEERFRHFLRTITENGARELIINGDLFDFWFEYRTVIPSRHYRVLAALRDLRDQGVPIKFLGGNHDAWGGNFLRDEVGIELLREGAEIEIAGRRALLVHGDGVGPGDWGYRILKRIIRNPLSVLGFRSLHPDWGARVAGVASTTEGKTGNAGGASVQRAEVVSKWARDLLSERPVVDLVLAGHTHTPEVTEYFPDRYYINTGDWINHFTYLELLPGQRPELKVWPD